MQIGPRKLYCIGLSGFGGAYRDGGMLDGKAGSAVGDLAGGSVRVVSEREQHSAEGLRRRRRRGRRRSRPTAPAQRSRRCCRSMSRGQRTQLGLLVRAEEKRVENLIHHHVIHYHLHFQRRKLIRLEMMDRWPYQLQMALADIVPHLRDKGRKDSLKIRDKIADSLVELHKD
ncbi:unnamed protein product [Urochloa humidicola]